MLERLADYDDALMEQLISDIEPPRDLVFDDLARELREGHVVPVLMGSATGGHGVTRLLKALRHESPGIAHTRKRLGVEDKGSGAGAGHPHDPHRPRRQIVARPRAARRFRRRRDGGQFARDRGAHRRPRPADGRDVLETDPRRGGRHGRLRPPRTPRDRGPLRRRQERAGRRGCPPPAADARRRHPRQGPKGRGAPRRALAKLCEEDRALSYVHDAEMSELKLFGQGEMHLRVTIERLADRFGVTVETQKPTVAYRESIRDAVTVRGRHKKQSGGHGQFGDVVVEVGPRGRGEGFAFAERVHGGSRAAAIFLVGRGRRARRAGARAARLSGRRRLGDPDRRLLSHRRFLRHGVPRRGEACARRGVGQGAAGAARADPRR